MEEVGAELCRELFFSWLYVCDHPVRTPCALWWLPAVEQHELRVPGAPRLQDAGTSAPLPLCV